MGKRIIFVDDSPTMRSLVSQWLTAGGHEVIACSNGEECLEQTARRRPDLVLSDVNMPGMNGFELCRALKAKPELAGMPVALLTRLDEAVDIVTGLGAGADDFIIKGKGQADLLARIDRITPGVKQDRLVIDERGDIFKALFEAIDREVSFDVLALLVNPSRTAHAAIVV